MISLRSKGNYTKTEKFLDKMRHGDIYKSLEQYAKRGVDALASATPIDTGKTASMWNYEIHRTNGEYKIVWTNDNINDGVNIAVILQYGHGTRNGGYVQGRDYINPAIQAVFDQIANSAWKEVTSA